MAHQPQRSPPYFGEVRAFVGEVNRFTKYPVVSERDEPAVTLLIAAEVLLISNPWS